MGCKKFRYASEVIMIDGFDDDVSCLCTFHGTYPYHIDPSTARSLAMLGAAVCLIRNGEMSDGPFVLPQDLPDWIVEELDHLLPNVVQGHE